MKKPTTQGRKIMDHLEGFKMYLKYAEQNQIAMLNKPTLDNQHFEKMFPFAIALGVDNEWKKYFESNTISDDSKQAKTDWYHSDSGSSISSMNIAIMVTVISSDSTAPSNFSGSGGSSSGGGGGGGVDGW